MVFAGIVLLTLWAILALPQMYCSEARLLVRFGDSDATPDPLAAAAEMDPMDEARLREIQSLLAILNSRTMLERLVESLGPEYVLTGRGEPQPFAPRPAEATLSPTAAHQQAVRKLEQQVEIQVPRSSNVLHVQCQASAPVIAQKLTSRLVEVCIDETVRLMQADGSAQISGQHAKHSTPAWEADAPRLRLEKGQLDFVAIEGQRKQLQDEIAKSDANVLRTRADLMSAEAQIAALEKLLASLPAAPATEEAHAANVSPDNASDELRQLEVREQELAATHGDNHPQLLAVRRQLADLRSALSEQQPAETQPIQAAQEDRAVNPSRRSVELSLLEAQSQLAALRQREHELSAQAAMLRGNLEQLTAQAAAAGLMQQKLVESPSKAQASKVEQAHLHLKRIAGLAVVQPATFPRQPVGPRPALVLAFGLGLAAISGLGSVLLAARFQPVLASRLELEQVWDLPLVGVVPRGAICLPAAS
jgi:uncharacterized protein involved in exopolysaccharide biosynthesis